MGNISLFGRTTRPEPPAVSLVAEKNRSSDFIHSQRRFFHLTIFRISIKGSKSVSIFCVFYRFLCAEWPVSAPKRTLGDASAPPPDSGPPLSITLISSDS